MDTKVTKYPSSPKEDSPGNKGDPLMDTRPSPERETNIMTQDPGWDSNEAPRG